jgi:hypothetical protein
MRAGAAVPVPGHSFDASTCACECGRTFAFRRSRARRAHRLHLVDVVLSFAEAM